MCVRWKLNDTEDEQSHAIARDNKRLRLRADDVTPQQQRGGRDHRDDRDSNCERLQRT